MSNGNKLSAFLRKKGMKKMISGSSRKDFLHIYAHIPPIFNKKIGIRRKEKQSST